MDKEKTYSITELVDISEDAIFSLVDKELENVGTLLIKDENATLFFEDDRDDIDFGTDFQRAIDEVRLLGLTFVKLNDPNRRWHQYNPNPKDRNTGDCTLRAYCAAFNITWNEAYDIATGMAKEEGYLLNASPMTKKILTEHFGAEVDPKYNTKVVKSKDRKTVAEFAMTHPYGIYVLHVPSHLVTVKNGEYWDSWDSGEKKVDTVYLV